MSLIQEISAEALEIINNINRAARNQEISWADGEDLKHRVLNDVADALGLPALQTILARYS